MPVVDDFRGDNAALVRSIEALLSLDEAQALVPHGLGSHAKSLLSASACRLLTPSGDAEGRAREALDRLMMNGAVEWYPEKSDDARIIRQALTPPPAPTEAAGLREAATKARDQFAFYASEHTNAGKAEKAATNQAFADLLTAALAKSPPAAVGEPDLCPHCNGCGWQNPAQAIDKCETCGGQGAATAPKPLGDVREAVERNRAISLRGAEYLRRLGEGGWGTGDIADAQYCADVIIALCLQPSASLAAPAVPDRDAIRAALKDPSIAVGFQWSATTDEGLERAIDRIALALKPGSQS